MGVAISDDVAAELAREVRNAAIWLTISPRRSRPTRRRVRALAQLYRKAYLRWIDGTTRLPDVRAARIAEVVDLLRGRVKERPRSSGPACPVTSRQATPVGQPPPSGAIQAGPRRPGCQS